MKSVRFSCTFLTCLIFSFTSISAQIAKVQKDTVVDYYDMSIEQLLSVKAHGVPSELEELINSLISVASKKPLSSRESPSIISLVTEDEIKKSGARDLIDVLRLVPGIDFGVDVQGVVGIGSRGNWAHEGKILMLIDGQEMNEILYASLQFGNHYPIESIKKIEVIRGPGSSIYGGFAEYGVINIITKNGAEINGANVSGTYGQMDKAFGRNNLSVSVGKKIKDLDFSISGYKGHANRSDRYLTDINGQSYNMVGNSNLDPENVNLGLTYKNFSFRGIYDNFKTTARDGYGTNLIDALPNDFKSYYTELKYNLKLGDKLTITPKFNYSRQYPWNFEGPVPSDSAYTPYNRMASRTKGNLSLAYKATRKINIILGGEFYRDYALVREENGTLFNGEKSASHDNYAFFTEGIFKHRIINVILGARYDKNSVYGSAFSPRVGLTKKYNAFHFKALYSHAFRAPGIENITYKEGAVIRPEKTRVVELEAGYQINKKMIFTANFFDISTKDPIIYFGESEEDQGYTNFKETGTRGYELEYRFKDNWGYVIANYSYYTANGIDKPETYNVPFHSSFMLGFAPHKVNLNSSFNITKRLSINPSFSFRSNRYAYTGLDSLGNGVLEKLKPTYFVNIFLRHTDFLTKGLNIGVGVYDVLNQKINFIQPYNSFHAPLPGPSREIVVKLEYNFNFKEKKNNVRE